MKKIALITICAIMMLMSVVSATAYEQHSRVRVVHASPDAPNVDVWANGNPLFEDAPFTGVTKYVTVPTAEYNVQVVPAGATEPVVIDADLNLRPWREYTVVAVDTLDNIEPVVLMDKNRIIPRTHSSVRFVHASPDAPAVDIAVKNGPVLFRSVNFKDAQQRRVRAGTYDLEVRLAGTKTVVLEVNNVELKGRTSYTAFAMGEVSEGTLQAVLSQDAKRTWHSTKRWFQSLQH